MRQPIDPDRDTTVGSPKRLRSLSISAWPAALLTFYVNVRLKLDMSVSATAADRLPARDTLRQRITIAGLRLLSIAASIVLAIWMR